MVAVLIVEVAVVMLVEQGDSRVVTCQVSAESSPGRSSSFTGCLLLSRMRHMSSKFVFFEVHLVAGKLQMAHH